MDEISFLDTIANTLGLEPLRAKLESFGWHVKEVDGHNYDELHDALTFKSKGKPHFIIANTLKGKGVSFMENKVEWHYKNPNDEQLKLALVELGVESA